jgi:hypothetical protein
MVTIDSCGCRKPPGAWGQSGWHFARWTKHSFVKRQLEKAREDTQGEPSTEMLDAWVAKFEGMAEHYAGVPYAYEPCRAYQDAIRKEVSLGKMKKTKGKHGNFNPDGDE